MKKKEKLALIDNYIELHRVIFECKDAIKHCENVNSLIELKNLSISLIDLKQLYEKTFLKYKMLDNSLILLKQQLEDALKSEKYPPQKRICTHQVLNDKKERLHNALLKYF